jgi:alcohol dehydrogenase class IV
MKGYTAAYSLRAVERIGKWLTVSYHHPTNLEAREQMLLASYEAGVAFTRASVGYVHAVAHQLGALFGVPHGVANAMVMPYVLDFYAEDDTSTDRFCELAVAIGIDGTKSMGLPSSLQLAKKRRLAAEFIGRVRAMNKEMLIPASVVTMTEADVDDVAARALKEAHGEGETFNLFDFGYPTPKYMDYKDMVKVVRGVLPSTPQVGIRSSL